MKNQDQPTILINNLRSHAHESTDGEPPYKTLSISKGQLRITATHVTGLTVLRLDGPLLLGPEREAMTAARSRLSMYPPVAVIVDLAGLTRLDSAGLGELVLVVTAMKRQGSRVAFAGPSRTVRELMLLTRICTLGPVFDDLDIALADFAISK